MFTQTMNKEQTKMSKKNKKDRGPRPLPRPNRQIPNSLVRSLTSIGQSPYLEAARDYPIYGCWIMEGWQDEGITPVVVARSQEEDRIMFGVYMVDFYCLGVKDVFARADYSRNRFERELPGLCAGDPVSCSVELAHELIYGALEYAQKLGFEPHPDFYKQNADKMLDPFDAHPRTNGVTFGKDGKPLYIAGPYDNEKKSRSVVNTLVRTCGLGNFDYVIGLSGMPDDLI
jgi:hypothetical protein